MRVPLRIGKRQVEELAVVAARLNQVGWHLKPFRIISVWWGRYTVIVARSYKGERIVDESNAGV